jgi:mannose-6-phosphate isomerase-like protein (cupin superfamily)
MGEPRIIRRGEGEVIGDAPDRRVEILSDADALHATWTRFGPRREGADLHVHRRHTDLFYVLDGELTVRLGLEDRAVAVPAGTLVRVPPLVAHGFRNGGDGPLAYLNLHAPGQGFAAFMRAMRDGRTLPYDQEPPPADGLRPATEAAIGGGEVLVDRPDLRVALLADAEEIGVSEAWSRPGAPSPPPHLHRQHAESFYVLEGEMTFTAGGQELRAEAGSWVQVPPGVPHTFSLGGSGPARFLNVHTPACGFGRFLRALHAAADEHELTAARAAFDQEPAPL